MFMELIARIPGFSIRRDDGGERLATRSDELAAAVAVEPTFEIFRRLRQGPVLVETVTGLVEARERMKQIAKEKPGVRYFATESKSHAVVAEIDATIKVKTKWRRVAVR